MPIRLVKLKRAPPPPNLGKDMEQTEHTSIVSESVRWKGLGNFLWMNHILLSLVSLGCITHCQRPGGLSNIYFSQVWGLGSPRWRCQLIQCLVSSPFLGCRWLFSCCILTQQREGDHLSVSSPKGINPIMRNRPSWPSSVPEAPPPNAITLGIGAFTYEFGRWEERQTLNL